MTVIDCGKINTCAEMSYWIKQGMLSVCHCYVSLLLTYLDFFFCTMRPFVLTSACHLHFMSIGKQRPTQYILFPFWILPAYWVKTEGRLVVILKKQKQKKNSQKYQLPLSEFLNRQFIQKVISSDYHIIFPAE